MVRRGRRGEKEGAIISKQVLSRRKKGISTNLSLLSFTPRRVFAPLPSDPCENPWKEAVTGGRENETRDEHPILV